jgi:hypothetical protein
MVSNLGTIRGHLHHFGSHDGKPGSNFALSLLSHLISFDVDPLRETSRWWCTSIFLAHKHFNHQFIHQYLTLLAPDML